MEDDLKEQGYRLIYGFTFVVVFCIVPLIFILSNSDINRKQNPVNCKNPQEIVEVLPSGLVGTPNQFQYRLKNGSRYESTVKYKVGDQVCQY